MEGGVAEEPTKKSEEQLRCGFEGCGKVYTTRAGLRYHMKTAHQGKVPSEIASTPGSGSTQTPASTTPITSEPIQNVFEKETKPTFEEVLMRKESELKDTQLKRNQLQERAKSLQTKISRTSLACELLKEFIDDAILDICFEVHRKAKLEGQNSFLNYNFSQNGDEKQTIDIYGNSPDVNTIQFTCPHCQRAIGASKFAPHLEKCMGLSRTVRLASKKKESLDLFAEVDEIDDNENMDGTYGADKKKRKSLKPKGPRKSKKQATLTDFSSVASSPDGGLLASLPSSPMTQKKNPLTPAQLDGLRKHAASILKQKTQPELHQILSQYCGCISNSTGKLCNKTLRCSIHSDEQRALSRSLLLQPEEILPFDSQQSFSFISEFPSTSNEHEYIDIDGVDE